MKSNSNSPHAKSTRLPRPTLPPVPKRAQMAAKHAVKPTIKPLGKPLGKPTIRPTIKAVSAATSAAILASFAGLAGLATVATAGCEAAPDAALEPVLRPVRYAAVAAIGGERKRTFSGVSEAGEASMLSFRVAGTVARVTVNLGDRVKANQVIAELERTDYHLQVEQAQANLASAQAQLRNAQAKYTQTQALFENQSASKADLDSARAANESAVAQVNAARKQVELARQRLSYTRLTAPVDGAIAAVLAERNENVNAGTPIVQLASGDKAKVVVAMPELLIAQVTAGDTTTVRFDALPNTQLAATISEVAVTTTQAGATFPVTVTLDEANDAVRPGMAAEVTFTFGAASDSGRIAVPPTAVGEDREGRFVFILEKSGGGVGVVRRHPVTVGDLSEEGLEISQGLAPGDLLVTAGVTRISDGLQVKVPNSNGDSNGAGGSGSGEEDSKTETAGKEDQP